MHEDLEKVVEHENREHPEKKQWKKSFSAEKSLVVVNHKKWGVCRESREISPLVVGLRLNLALFIYFLSFATITSVAFITASTLSPALMFNSSAASLDISAVTVVGA